METGVITTVTTIMCFCSRLFAFWLCYHYYDYDDYDDYYCGGYYDSYYIL